MSTHIHVSGLSYFCTDDTLRQAFTPFGTVVLAHVLRDECGHSLGLGIVHMGCSEDVERISNAHQHFEIAGSRMDLWEPVEPAGSQRDRWVACDMRSTRATQRGEERGPEPNGDTIHPVAALIRRLIMTLVSSSRTIQH